MNTVRLDIIFDALKIQIRLADLYSQVDSRKLLIYLCHINNLGSGDYYEDYSPGANNLIAEFIGLYYSFQPINKVEFQEVHKFLNIAGEFQKLSDLLIAKQTIIRNWRDKGSMLDEDSISTISNKLRRESAVVKNSGFPFHHEEIMIELYKDYEDDIRKAIGYTYSEIIQIVRAVPNYLENQLGSIYKEFHNGSKKVESEIRYYRKRGRLKSNSKITVGFANSFDGVSNKELLRNIKNTTIEFIVDGIIDKFVLKPEDLQSYVNLTSEKIDKILNSFSILKDSVGFFPDTSYGLVPFVNYPYIKLDSGYIIPSIRNITWSASNKIEKVIKNSLNNKRYEKFKKYKHDKLMSISMTYLNNLMLDLEISYENLYYLIGDNRFEVDGLIKVDNKLFVIEFKSHHLTDSARRGYQPRVEKHFNEIVIDPYEQAKRCVQFINSNSVTNFIQKDGKKVTIVSDSIEEIIPVSITLAQLGHITSGLKNSHDSRYFETSTYPWTVNIYDLKIICDLLRNSAELVDYIHERALFLKESKLSTNDELDIFAYYQNRTLNSFKKLEDYAKFDWGYLSNATDDINHYYFNKYGNYFKGKVDKPLFKLPDKIIPIINKIILSKKPNRIDLCLHIFNMDLKSINFFVKRLSVIIKSNSKSKSHHDFTIASRDSDRKNIAITTVIDSDFDRVFEVSKFLKKKRLNDSKIKNGFILKLISKGKKYTIEEIEKYDRNS